MNTVYERAVAEAAKRAFNGEAGAEVALALFWTGYCDALVGFQKFNFICRADSQDIYSEPTALERKWNTPSFNVLFGVYPIRARYGHVTSVTWCVCFPLVCGKYLSGFKERVEFAPNAPGSEVTVLSTTFSLRINSLLISHLKAYTTPPSAIKHFAPTWPSLSPLC